MRMTKRKHQKVIHRVTVSPLGKHPQLPDSDTTNDKLHLKRRFGQKHGPLCLVFHQMTTSLDVTFVQRLVGYNMQTIILKFTKLKL